MFWKKKIKIERSPHQNFLEKINGKNKSFEKERKKILAIVSFLADGILVFDKKNKLSLINPQAQKFLNIKNEEVLGDTILKLSRFPNAKTLVSILGGGIKEVSRKEIKIRENFILQASSVSMKVEGEKMGSLIILHDISHEKIIEKMKSSFVTVTAHQLRTPSSVVKWALQMFLEGDFGKITKKQREIIKKAYNTNEKMIKLVGSLLDVAQIEEGKYILKLVLLDLEAIIQSVIDSHQQEILEKNIKFKFQKLKVKLPKLMLNEEKIKIAVTNLIGNAIKYTLVGGEVSVILAKRDEEIEVRVKDTGMGIPENQKRKVFTKFFRGKNIMRVETEGTGLGLFISKSIIEAHNGKIWFDSQENKGTTFYFTIPIKEKFSEYLSKDFY